MSRATASPGSPRTSFISDEIGIETASWGAFRLRSLYEPIFERRGMLLHRIGVEGKVVPYAKGQPLGEPYPVNASVGHDFEQVCQLLHIRNHRNIGPSELDLFLDMLPCNLRGNAGTVGDFASLTAQMLDADLDPGQVAGVIYAPFARECSRLVDQLRRSGGRVAIGDFGAGEWHEEQLHLIRPDVVRMDGDWFSQVCRHDSTAGLFATIVDRLHALGARLAVKGIDTPAKFDVAFRSGVDLFQGPFLAGPALAGAEFDETPIDIAEILERTARGSRTHG